MRFRLYMAIAVLPLAGCVSHPDVSVWPDTLPLAADMAAYRAGEEPAETGAAEPAGPLDLSAALALALKGNPDLAAGSREVRAREAAELQASLLPNPELELEIEDFGGRDGLSGFDGAESTLQLGQLIELGGKRARRARVAALEAGLAGWDYEARRLEVLTETAVAFIDVLAAQERTRFSAEALALSQLVLQTVTERVKAGKVSPLEQTRASIALFRSRIDQERARHALHTARKKLASMWGSLSPRFEKATGDLYKLGGVPSEGGLYGLVGENPGLARWIDEIRQRQAALASEQAKGVPDVTVFGGARRFEETDDYAFLAGFSLPLPVFDRNQGGVREAEHRLAKAAHEREAVRLRVRTALTEAYEMLETHHAEALSLERDVLPAAKSTFEAISDGYKQGAFGYVDVLDAQRTLFEVREQHLGAAAGYHRWKARVEGLIGRSLDGIPERKDP